MQVRPEDVLAGSSKRRWWICHGCACGHPHEWQVGSVQPCLAGGTTGHCDEPDACELHQSGWPRHWPVARAQRASGRQRQVREQAMTRPAPVSVWQAQCSAPVAVWQAQCPEPVPARRPLWRTAAGTATAAPCATATRPAGAAAWPPCTQTCCASGTPGATPPILAACRPAAPSSTGGGAHSPPEQGPGWASCCVGRSYCLCACPPACGPPSSVQGATCLQPGPPGPRAARPLFTRAGAVSLCPPMLPLRTRAECLRGAG